MLKYGHRDYISHTYYVYIFMSTTIISYPCTFMCVYVVYCNCCTCNLQLATFFACIVIAPVFFLKNYYLMYKIVVCYSYTVYIYIYIYINAIFSFRQSNLFDSLMDN